MYVFVGNLIKFQVTNDVLIRIMRFLEKKDGEANLLFDANAKTIASSIYGFLAHSFRESGIALRHDNIILSNRIVHYVLLDSKLDHAMQLADIVAYGIREILQYHDKEVYFRLEPMLDKGPRGKV